MNLQPHQIEIIGYCAAFLTTIAFCLRPSNLGVPVISLESPWGCIAYSPLEWVYGLSMAS